MLDTTTQTSSTGTTIIKTYLFGSTWVDDGDGVSPNVEDAAPNGGDGNGDGVKDSLQSNVTSIPSATGRGYITLVNSNGCDKNLEVQTVMPSRDAAYVYPYGLISFKLPCSNATVRIYFHDTESLQGFEYRKYGSKAPDFDAGAQWYTMPNATFGTAQIGGKSVAYVEFSLQDGALGDDTPGDGMIVDAGGPGQSQHNVTPGVTVPLDPKALLLLGFAILLLGGWSVTRRA